MTTVKLQDNLDRVRERIAAAALRAGVPLPQLIAVTKSCDDNTFRALLSFGVDAVGENRTRQCAARADIICASAYDCKMHFIGSLQKNKVKYLMGKAALIHSVDSVSLAKEIDRLSEKIGIRFPILAEVNSGREENKGGIFPEELDEFVHCLTEFPHLSLRGLMTMAPNCADQEEYRPYFRATRQAFDRLSACFDTESPILSMGMSNSYEIAIEEGATLVRVGSALFRTDD